jgi:hypothetical protein
LRRQIIQAGRELSGGGAIGKAVTEITLQPVPLEEASRLELLQQVDITSARRIALDLGRPFVDPELGIGKKGSDNLKGLDQPVPTAYTVPAQSRFDICRRAGMNRFVVHFDLVDSWHSRSDAGQKSFPIGQWL